jgi:hypothetical protein
MAAGLSMSEEFIALFNNWREAAGNSPSACQYYTRMARQFVTIFHLIQVNLVYNLGPINLGLNYSKTSFFVVFLPCDLEACGTHNDHFSIMEYASLQRAPGR